MFSDVTTRADRRGWLTPRQAERIERNVQAAGYTLIATPAIFVITNAVSTYF